MSIFTRRFLTDPGDVVLLNIESVNILDLAPPASIQGVGSGTVLLVGEFENGPFNFPQQLLGTNDLARTWGTLGYQYGGLVAQYPSAPVRAADGLAPEYWNGNTFVQISGLTFASLIFVRVDTSVGSVAFSPLAFVEGTAEFNYNLTSGQHLDVTASALHTTIRTAMSLPQATINVMSTTGFPGSGEFVVDGQVITYSGVTSTTFTGCTGGTGIMSVGDDVVGGTPAVATFTGAVATYSTASTTIASGSNGVTLPTGTIHVTSTTGFPTVGSFEVDGSTVTYTGITGGNTFTGCAGGVATLATTDVVTAGGYPEALGGGTLVLAVDYQPNFTVTFQSGDNSGAQVAARINSYAGFTMATFASGVLTLVGKVVGTAGAVQIISGSAGVLGALGLVAGTYVGTGNIGNSTSVTFAEIKAVVEGAISGTRLELNASGGLRLSFTTDPGTGWITIAASTTAAGLGFTAGEVNGSVEVRAGVLPAGTVVQDAGANNILVTMQDVNVAAGAVGPYSVKVRYAVDNGTGAGTGNGTVVVVRDPPSLGSFAVTNANPIAAALTENQIDAAYVKAIKTTTDINSVAKVANITVSARQSNTVRSQLKQNALYASANGCFGRMACVSPPLNTNPQTALSALVAPGVGATRDQRVVYCYVGANTFVQLIGQLGLAGGIGFTATGNVDVHSDILMASLLSQLPPEENPGQETSFTSNVNGIETGANVQGFDISTYMAFKAAGIAALRIDNGVAIFQSGVTSVDPSASPALTRISRRRMADFIEDSISLGAKPYGKKLSLQARRKALKGEIRAFMGRLLSKNNPGAQRIAGYTVSDSDGNSDATLGAGMYRITVKARTLASLDSIVIATTVGEEVDVAEVLPQAA